MNVRDRIMLDQRELDALLDECDKVVVATIGPDSAPHLSMLYFAMVDGKIAFTTYGASQKVVNLRRDPRITCMVETGDGYAQLRSAVLFGRGLVVDDADTVLRVGAACAARLSRGERSNQDEDALRRAMHKRVAVFVEIGRVASWDHRKLAAPAPYPDAG